MMSEGRELSRNALGLFVALSLMNSSNYLFHVIVSRALGPSSYGALSSLLAVLLVLSVPLNVLQTTVAKRTSLLRGDGRTRQVPDLTGAAMRIVAPGAAIVSLGVLGGAPLIDWFLHVGVLSVALLAAYTFLSLLLSVPLGALQGLMRFRALAVAMAVGVVVRVVAGLALVHAGYGVFGALIATVLSPAVSLVFAQRALHRGQARRSESLWSVTLLRGDFWLSLLGLGSFWLLAALDIVLARHYLRTQVAGYYASADVLARALLFLPGAVSTAAFPRFVQVARTPHEGRRWLAVTTAAVVGLSAIGMPVLVVLRTSAISMAFGGRYSPAAHFVPGLALAMVLLAVANLLVYFHIAAGTRSHVVMFAAAILEIFLIALFHASAGQIIAVVIVVSGAVTALLAHAALAVTRAKRSSTAPAASSASSTAGVSLVLPCHNAGAQLAAVLRQAIDQLADTPVHEIIVVSDGSTDDTARVAERFADDGVRVIEYADNGGKGHALSVGLSEARGRYIAFMDSDGDIGAEALRPFLKLMEMYRPDIVLGSKRHPLSEVDYPPIRRALSWAYHKMTRFLFRVNVRDTQTGMKLIRRDVLAQVLPHITAEGYAFDLEMIVIAKQMGFDRVFEAPVRINYRFTSQMGLRTPLLMFAETMRVFFRRYVLDSYSDRSDLRVTTSNRPRQVLALPTTDAPERRPLRILILNWRDISNPEAGGAEVFTHEVARRWASEGHEVSLLTSRFRGGRASEVVDGVRITRVGMLRRGTYHLLVQRRLAALTGYDVILDEINTLPFLTPVWQDDLPPVVALIHQLAEDVWDAEVPRALAGIGRRVEPMLLKMYRDVPVATMSSSTMLDLRRLGLRDVRVVLEGRDDAPLTVDLDKEDVPTFLFVGRLVANKRPDHAIEAFSWIKRSLPDARLWVVGRGSMEAALRRIAPDGVEFLGKVARDELYERMARAHCLLVPSVREGWGLVVTEANGVGTPAVGYDAPGIRDSIKEGRTGSLVPAGDPRSLATAAIALITDEERYASIRREARRWAECFSWDATADLLLRLLRERVTTHAEEVTVGDLAPAN